MSSHRFITFKVKIGIMELGNDDYFFLTSWDYIFSKLIRYVLSNSLKTYELQDQLVVDKLGARC
jgi:hypothetical protein